MLLKTVFMRHTRNTITSAPQLRKTLQTTLDAGFGFAGTTEEIVHDRITDLLAVLRRAASGIQLALRAEPRAAS